VGFGSAYGDDTLWQAGFTTTTSLNNFDSGEAPFCFAWRAIVNATFGVPYKKIRLGSGRAAGNTTLASNLPVSMGDVVSVKIEKAAPGKFQGAATFTMVNLTQSVTTSFTLFAETPLLGNQVEWICEQPADIAPPGPITPQYGAVYFDDATCRFGVAGRRIGRDLLPDSGPSIPS
jgi:hypothetical protein